MSDEKVEYFKRQATRVARMFVAGLAQEFESRMEALLKDVSVAKGKELAEWMENNFHFQGAKTPKGGKALKEDLNKLHWWLKNGLQQQVDPSRLLPTLEKDWDSIKGHLAEIVKLFSEEGGKVVPKEMKVGSNTYLNVSGFSETQLKGYIKSLESVFDELKGWRKKALVGGLKVALAGPDQFRGTVSGKYRVSEDTLWVRATPAILKRTRGTYAAFDYIIVHEVGHRYEYKYHPSLDFDKPEWWTSKYSKTEGEAFAELFALSNFELKGPWDYSVVEKFEEYMTSGKVPEREPVELPEHLKKLVDRHAQEVRGSV